MVSATDGSSCKCCGGVWTPAVLLSNCSMVGLFTSVGEAVERVKVLMDDAAAVLLEDVKFNDVGM